MLGAIAGDIIGSVYEARPIKTEDFPLFRWDCRFTDDTVLSVAVAEALMRGIPYADALKNYYQAFPNAGYGWMFIRWARSASREPYNSWGNGAAMRASPVGFACQTLDEVLADAQRTAEVTHNHPEGVKGAQATAAAVFLARTGSSKDEIRTYVRKTFRYGLRETLAEIRPDYRFDASCQGTVPVAVTAFLESANFEDAVRKAVSVGGDSDTLACITGGIAQAFYGGVPNAIAAGAYERLHPSLAEVVREFCLTYGCDTLLADLSESGS